MAYIYNMADTWADAGTTFTAIKMNVLDTASNAASLLMDLQVGGSSRFNVTKAGHLRLTTVVNSTNATISTTTSSNSGFYTADGTDWGYTRAGSAMWQSGIEYFRFTSNSSVGWSTSVGSAADLTLFRDAADILAQRRGTNPQTIRIYNTFTDASNFERGFMAWGGSVLQIGTEGAGTGSARPVQLTRAGISHIQLEASRTLAQQNFAIANTFQLHFSNGADYSRGFSTNAAGGLAVTNGSTGGQSLEFREIAAPAAPATNGVYIYAEDNGSGKTRLMARFATGAAVQIAIEP